MVPTSPTPNLHAATACGLHAVGHQTVIGPKAGCCCAVKYLLNDQAGGMADVRANIRAWWPLVEQGGGGAIGMHASGLRVTGKVMVTVGFQHVLVAGFGQIRANIAHGIHQPQPNHMAGGAAVAWCGFV